MTSSDDQLIITPTVDGFVIVGEIDTHTAPSLASTLAEVGDTGCTVDLAGVSFIDSSGLRVLIEAHQRAIAGGWSVHLVQPSPAVRRLFEISGADQFLNVDRSAP